jgi:hypothetical protein
VALAAVAAVLAGSALATVLLTRSDAPGPYAPTTNLAETGAVQRVDPKTGKLEATLRFRGAPLDLRAGSGAVWLADQLDNVVYRIDADSYEVIASEGGARQPVVAMQTLASESDSVWLGALSELGRMRVYPVTASVARSASPIDITSLAARSERRGLPVLALTQLVPGPAAGSTGAFSGWVLDSAAGVLRKVRSGAPGVLSPPFATGGAPHVATTTSAGGLWIGQEREVVRIAADQVAVRVRLPTTPVALAAVGDGVWVATVGGTLALVDAEGTVVRTLRTPGTPIELELAGGSLWLLTRDGTLAKLDPVTGKSRATEKVGNNAVALAADEDAIWVAVRGGRQLERSELPARLAFTEGFPNSFVPDPCGPASGSDRCRQAFILLMRAESGQRAGFNGYWWERRVRGGEVVCKGKKYGGPVTSAARNAGSGMIWIEQWGTLAVHIDRAVVVADRLAGAPTCTDATGTWIATSGVFKGERGEFSFMGVPRHETIVLR